MDRLDLLAAVALHKSIFFADSAAKYDEAKPGRLRLVPPESRQRELREDYGKMREMIFGEPPSFEHLLEVLSPQSSDNSILPMVRGIGAGPMADLGARRGRPGITGVPVAEQPLTENRWGRGGVTRSGPVNDAPAARKLHIGKK